MEMTMIFQTGKVTEIDRFYTFLFLIQTCNKVRVAEHHLQPRLVRPHGCVLPVLCRGVPPPAQRPVRTVAVVHPAGQRAIGQVWHLLLGEPGLVKWFQVQC